MDESRAKPKKKDKAKDKSKEQLPEGAKETTDSLEVAPSTVGYLLFFRSMLLTFNEGSALNLLAPDIRRRQRSLLGFLTREETKASTMPHNVQEVRRLAHVTFDTESQKFLGLPPEWEAAVNTSFGLPLALCRSSQVPRYESRIPNILLTMGQYLLEHGGRNVKGIFRIAPDQTERDAVLEQLANGTFVSCNDIHCISTAIKVWFRELPACIFRDIDEEKVKTCDSDADAAAILARCPEPALSVLQWLMDLSVEIINNSAVNLMSAKNMSIVVTPNLYRVKETENPTEMLFLAKKFTDFFERCLNNRIAEAKTAATKEETEEGTERVTESALSTQKSISFTIDLDDAALLPKVADTTAHLEVVSPKAQSETNDS